MSRGAQVIGIHPIVADEPLHLIELEIAGEADDFDFDEVTQEIPGQPRSNWQAVYDERKIGKNRVAFFLPLFGYYKAIAQRSRPASIAARIAGSRAFAGHRVRATVAPNLSLQIATAIWVLCALRARTPSRVFGGRCPERAARGPQI